MTDSARRIAPQNILQFPESIVNDGAEKQVKINDFEIVLDRFANVSRGVHVVADAVGYALRPSLSQRILFWSVGSLLTLTAVAKLWMLLTDPFADVRVFLAKEVLWMSVGFEFWLALLNFRLRDVRLVMLLDITVFTLFAAFACLRWGLGYTSCGCSGSLELPTWFFALLDIVLVGALVYLGFRKNLLRGGFAFVYMSWHSLKPTLRGQLFGLVVAVAIVFAVQIPVFSPLKDAIFGRVPIQAMVVVSGKLAVSEESFGVVEIWNRTSYPARIVGVARSCSCFDLSEDPTAIVIPPHSRISRGLTINPRKSGPLHQRIELFVDHPEQFRVTADFLGSVVGVEKRKFSG